MRGPMFALVTPGWAMLNAAARWRHARSGSLRTVSGNPDPAVPA